MCPRKKTGVGGKRRSLVNVIADPGVWICVTFLAQSHSQPRQPASTASLGEVALCPRACRVDHFSLFELLAATSRQRRTYAEVLRVPALSAGVYELSAGSDDRQKPHSEDEVYVVLRGRAKATVNGQTVTVNTGSLLYVPARVPHHFHDIEDDLTVLVLFAPAETTAAADELSFTATR